MAERWIINPAGENTGVPIVLPLCPKRGGVQVVEHATPPPAPKPQWVDRREGASASARDYENRTVTLKVQVFPPNDVWRNDTHDFGAPPPEAEGDGTIPGWSGTIRQVAGNGSPLPPALIDLQAALATLQESGGTLTRVMADGARFTFDVETASSPDGAVFDIAYYVGSLTTVSLEFTCRPFWRGPEVVVASGTKPTNARALTFNGVQIPGDAPAEVRIVVGGTTNAQRSLVYGVDQPSTATAGTPLELPVGDLVRPSGSSLTTTDDPSGPPDNRVVYRPEPSGLAAGTEDDALYLYYPTSGVAVEGTFRVVARVFVINTFANRLRLRWGVGSPQAAMSVNDSVTFPASTATGWKWADLGTVTVPKGAGGLFGAIQYISPYTYAYIERVNLIPTVYSGALMVGGRTSDPNLVNPGQTVAVTSRGATRSSVAGLSSPVPVVEGTLPFLPAPGRTGRSARIVVIAARADLRTGVDDQPRDSFTAQVYATPRGRLLSTTILPVSEGVPDPGALYPADDLYPDDTLFPS